MKKLEKSVPIIRFKGFYEAWEQRKLEELAAFSKGSGYTKNDLVEKGMPLVLYGRLYTKYETIITEVNTFTKMKDKSVISKGNEVVVPSSGETAKDISRASVIGAEGFILGGDLNIIKPKRELNSIFLALTISNGEQQKEIIKRAQGKSVVHVYNTDLKQVKLSYPTFNEQEKIGSFFRQLDNAIALHQRKLDALKLMKKAFLQQMFPNSEEKVPRLRFVNFDEEWEQRMLNEIANRYDNLRVPITASARISGTTPYYGANGIQDYVEGFTHDGEFILVAEDGANDVKNYPVQYVNGKIWVNNHAHVLQAKENKHDNKFLMNAIKMLKIEPFLVGGGRAKLNSDVMMTLIVKLPCYEEQKKIGTFLQRLDNAITLHKNKINKLSSLKKTYLQNMFI
ncbi:restriction endonuclease subunit S [Listeria monocytogenes]|uniref:restriction endonuclease subunit S n=4 Tax=Listeria monocytogenes TaxID=1639 RepID=UPI000779FB96|nr:restriction endonuclease subunit S [Listeria monocytogenes]EHC5091373.1 restriction endonuclease subunit S [Listeria monocytogenes serotype 1/2a]EDO0913830.1 restriction endonuclease subunit S [Listeria monocytogenes]EHC6238407.1 restriction endonuclease subunit S [Listeria monocytogenes serotype 1/2a]EID2549006.1 restriction endonuclease subunit S [Listeria monocytogenes]EJP1864188.1 restriction endonuclease subunit S [Listeria monocytogenes]